MKTYDTLIREDRDDGITLLTLNRPASANALNTQMGLDLLDVFRGVQMEPERFRCLVLTGAGDKAFCAGGDLRERNGMTDAQWRSQHIVFEQALYAMMDCPVPVVAAVNGVAYGGGAEIALFCDFIHAVENARFAFPEAKLGIMPGGGGTQNLPRAIGLRRAKELAFTGRPFTSKEAENWGMVNHVWQQAELLPGVLRLAGKIAAQSPVSVRQLKRAMTMGADTDLKTGLAIEIEAYNRTVSTQDRREGVLAYNEGRTPQFTGN